MSSLGKWIAEQEAGERTRKQREKISALSIDELQIIGRELNCALTSLETTALALPRNAWAALDKAREQANKLA